jgi:hypothetical protein
MSVVKCSPVSIISFPPRNYLFLLSIGYFALMLLAGVYNNNSIQVHRSTLTNFNQLQG